MKKIFVENAITIFYALIIAIIIRSLLIQPFYIPSSSMEPNLLVGDRLFVTKYSYGYSKHSFPFSPPIFQNRILFQKPERGDVVVFKTPADNRTDYIKRLIGLPGDTVQFIDGNIYLNSLEIFKDLKSKNQFVFCGSNKIESNFFSEKLSNGKEFNTAYFGNFTLQNTDLFVVPDEHYFFLGDNRDCSKDSRFLSSVGYVHKNNLVGKARFIFFSSDARNGSIFEFWKWDELIRFDRFFKVIN
tara:strand:+ start:240 stop:968 length:729 start_codon:yes stop_codon:yes gene_type:complete